MKKSRIAAAVSAAVVSAAALAVSASAYNGYILVQDTVYSFRNAWHDGSYGRDAGNNAFQHMTMNCASCEEGTYEEYEDNYDYDLGTYLIGDFTDVTINEPGTYTVSVNNFDWTLDGANSFNLLEVSTDLPLADGWSCTSASVIVDGAVAQTFQNPINDSEEYVQPIFSNIWNPDLTDAYAGAYPTTSLAIEFTIEKAGGAAADTAEAAPTVGNVDAATDSSKGSPDTGIADVAAVAGLAILAGAGIAFTRKSK